MAEVHLWLMSWEHECCGDHRKVGDTITVDLSFDGDIDPSTEPDHVEALRDGGMLFVGTGRDAHKSQPALIVQAGPVEFGAAGKYHPGRLTCRGKLWEERHGDPGGGPAVGEVTGRITSIRWRPAIYEKTGMSGDDEYRSIGYGEGETIFNTDRYPGRPKPISPLLADVIAHPEKYNAKFVSVKDQPPPSGWAFVFTLEV
jgi:hypothetical protein